jgi:Ca2+/Na+ antiporter
MLGCVLANLIIVLGTIAMIKILKDIERQERQNIKREYISEHRFRNRAMLTLGSSRNCVK